MNELRVKPRKKPVLFADAILLVMILISLFLLQSAHGGKASGLSGALLATTVTLMIFVTGGYLRSVLVFRKDGILAITALFAHPVLHKWRTVARVIHEDHNYAIYSTQNEWIGTVDDRNQKIQNVLQILKSHGVRISEKQSIRENRD